MEKGCKTTNCSCLIYQAAKSLPRFYLHIAPPLMGESATQNGGKREGVASCAASGGTRREGNSLNPFLKRTGEIPFLPHSIKETGNLGENPALLITAILFLLSL
jgi:hypothetical protein